MKNPICLTSIIYYIEKNMGAQVPAASMIKSKGKINKFN